MTKKENKNDDILGLVLTSALGFVLGLVTFLVAVPVLALGFVLCLVSFLGLGLGLRLNNEKYFWIFMGFYIIGALGGVIDYQQIQINSLSANAIATTILPSTYQGVVQAIYSNSPSSITFTSGATWQGNISKVSDLGIGMTCTLIQNSTSIMIQKTFLSGSCHG